MLIILDQHDVPLGLDDPAGQCVVEGHLAMEGQEPTIYSVSSLVE
jgi:hypothetical protein